MRKESPTLDTRLLEAQGYSMPAGGMPMEVSPKGSEKPNVVLEIRGGKDRRHVERIVLPTDRGVFIQDIVQQAKLHEKFGRLQISIMRPHGIGMPPVRLDAQTDSDGQITNVATNYALLPGDHVIVNEDSRSSLEKFLDSQFSNK
jgi:hypothetical protein